MYLDKTTKLVLIALRGNQPKVFLPQALDGLTKSTMSATSSQRDNTAQDVTIRIFSQRRPGSKTYLAAATSSTYLMSITFTCCRVKQVNATFRQNNVDSRDFCSWSDKRETEASTTLADNTTSCFNMNFQARYQVIRVVTLWEKNYETSRNYSTSIKVFTVRLDHSRADR